jgi:dTDP-4-dehydrorhamnose reductase
LGVYRDDDLAIDPRIDSKLKTRQSELDLLRRSKMKILILGGAGMLGHKLFQRLRRSEPDTYCTIRGSIDEGQHRNVELFRAGGVVENFEAADFPAVERFLLQSTPSVVVNCIGIVKQRANAKKTIPSIEVNALLPHRLAALCERWGGRLIHFSTDCVFSGRKGNYQEEDFSDAEDLYGRTKFLGEVVTGGAITLRTSIIGRELAHRESLLEWFLRQNHQRISGYTRAMFSGVTTNYMARVVEKLILEFPGLSGLYQVTSPTISKFELLCLLREAYRLDVEIERDPSFVCDRSMKGDKFARATGITRPSWPELIGELAKDDTPYESWK